MATIVSAASPAPEMVWNAIRIIHYTFPALCFLYFVLALTITVCTLQNTQSLRIKDQKVRRDVVIGLLLVVTSTYIGQVVAMLIEVVLDGKSNTEKDSVSQQHVVIYLLASCLVFGIQSLALIDTKFPVWYPYYVTWFIAIIVEIALLVIENVYSPSKASFIFVVIAIQALRIAAFIILTALYLGLRNDNKQYENLDGESQSLLRKKLAPDQGSEESTKTANGYGTTNTEPVAQLDTTDNASEAGSEDSWLEDRRKTQERIAKRLKQDGSWFTYAKGFAIFFPYVWPVNSRGLQFRAVLVGVCLLSSNALNVLVPNQLGNVIDGLKRRIEGTDSDHNIWLPVVIYAALLFANGEACIGWLRRWLWMPVEQYSYDALSTASHAHIMSLSSDFHESKTSSDLAQAVSGGHSVADLLETVCFEVIPMFIDLAVAFAYLWSYFGPYMGFIMAVTVVSYLYITTKLIAMRAEKRREYVTLYRKEWTVGQQSLDGWSTASLFNMIPHERHRYACAVKDHLQVKRAYEISSQSIGAAQGLVMTLGFLGALFLGVYQVAITQQASIGKFTTLLVYWAQLQSPLVFFSNMYRSVSYSLMDAERLLELFQTKPTIVDLPHAKALKFGKGEVKFDKVSFAYDERKPTLKDVTFTVPAGKTVAIVGETGGGKSTILKLIHRFYDVKSGQILVDGQDLRDITLNSLRDKIGVVPQDPMLFNDSIMNNVRYARTTATDTEVYEACKAAAIHEKIVSFPDGYNAKVGDRGVKLSGGEKQRVAIARAILKKPEIMLLDEATSAVDTDTEYLIQEGLRALCKDRTTFIVAHRLSTIMRADRIVVVMNGEIVEQGTHDELIHANGKYLGLWSKQVYIQPTKDHARIQSPKKRDAEIINDLTSSRQKAELAKIIKTTTQDKPTTDEGSAEESAQNTEHSAIDSGQCPTFRISAGSSMHLKGEGGAVSSPKAEGSKLKPEAPEFIPLTTNTVDSKPSKTDAKNAAKEQRKFEKQERNEQKQQRKAGYTLSKKSGKHVRQHDGADDAQDSLADENASGDPTERFQNGMTGSIDKNNKRSRIAARRQMSKSEPASGLDDSLDGTHDSEFAAVGPDGGQSLLQGISKRRVSAPGDAASVPPKSGNRHNRGRYWRLKSRAGASTGSGSGSGTTAREEINNAVPAPSVSSHGHPPNAPSTCYQATTTTIRFAPGA